MGYVVGILCLRLTGLENGEEINVVWNMYGKYRIKPMANKCRFIITLWLLVPSVYYILVTLLAGDAEVAARLRRIYFVLRTER